MDIKAKDIKRLLLRLYKRYQSGAISETQAQKEAYLLNSILKAIEVTDLEDRVTRMEETINVTLELN
jgi:histone H3/H4